MKIFFQVCTFVFILYTFCYATAGGPQKITILGIDEDKNTACFLYNYEHGGDQLPDIISFDINNKTLITESPKKYAEPVKNFDDYFAFKKRYLDFLAKLKNKVVPLSKSATLESPLTIKKVIEGRYYKYYRYGGRDDGVPYWKYEVSIAKDYEKVTPFYLETFYQNNIDIIDWAQTKDRKITFLVLRYEGIPFETGYTMDYLVVIPQETQRIEIKFDPARHRLF